MTISSPPGFQIHWALVPSDEAADLAPPGCRLLAIWPAPVNHDVCFEAAGFTLFGDNDEQWGYAAETLLQQVIEQLSRFGAVQQVNAPIKDEAAWYLRAFRTGREAPLLKQALWPMLEDSLPPFHARFGAEGASLRTGAGHFLLWITLPACGVAPCEFVQSVAAPWDIHETRLRWRNLLP